MAPAGIIIFRYHFCTFDMLIISLTHHQILERVTSMQACDSLRQTIQKHIQWFVVLLVNAPKISTKFND